MLLGLENDGGNYLGCGGKGEGECSGLVIVSWADSLPTS